MTEPNLSGGGPDSASAPICPWCSAPLKTGKEETCPSCGAALHQAAESEVPGVTRVDHEAILKSRAPIQHGRGLLGKLLGEYEAEEAPDSPGSIAPPEEAVRREMLRLEIAALEVEVHARQAEVAAEIAEAQEDAGEAQVAEDEAPLDAPDAPPADAADVRPDEAGGEAIEPDAASDKPAGNGADSTSA